MKTLIICIICVPAMALCQSVTEKYFKAMEGFRTEEAYGYLSSGFKSKVSLDDFKKGYPETMMKGLRMYDKTFFTFKVTEKTRKGDTTEYQVAGRAPYVKLIGEAPISEHLKFADEFLRKEAVNQGKEYTPEFVHQLFSGGGQGNFGDVIFYVKEAKGTMRIEREVIAAVQSKLLNENLDQEIDEIIGPLLWQGKADFDADKAISTMLKYKKSHPSHFHVTTTLPEYEALQAIVKSLVIVFDTKQPVEKYGHDMFADFENNSGKAIKKLYLQYEFTDADGNKVAPMSGIREYYEGVIPAGFKGKIKIGFLWDDIEVIQRSTASSMSVKWVELAR